MSQRLTLWTPAILWAAIIFTLSARQFGPDYKPLFTHFDKLQHIGVYAVLGWLIGRSLLRAHGQPLVKAAVLAIALTALYGMTDEWHQSFVPTRTASVADWLGDLVGAALGQLPLWYESRRSQKADRQAA